MSKADIIKNLKNNIVAVIRIKDTNIARCVTEQLIKSGFKFIELTLSIDNAPDLIKELKQKHPYTYIGAGTVLTVEECEEVIKGKADFIVSPCINEDVIKACNKNDLLCLPGAATPTEINTCYNLGCKVVKIFPGETLGPSFIKSIKAPMPFVECMPSGGVSLDNISDWFQSGAYAVSVGSSLYNGIDEDNLDILAERAVNYLKRIPS